MFRWVLIVKKLFTSPPNMYTSSVSGRKRARAGRR